MEVKVFIYLILWGGLCSSISAQTPTTICPDSTTVVSMDLPKKIVRSSLIELDSSSRFYLGETLSEHLEKITDVRIYEVRRYLATEADSLNTLEGFPILDTIEIDQSQKEKWVSLLTDDQSYIEDKNIKNLCLFLPAVGMELAIDGQPIRVLVSLDCKMVRFYTNETGVDNEYTEFNIGYSFDGFGELYSDCIAEMQAKRKRMAKKSASFKKTEKTEKAMAGRKQLFYKVKTGEGWSHVAKNASKMYQQEITMDRIFEINSINRKKAIAGKIILQPGQEVLVGYDN